MLSQKRYLAVFFVFFLAFLAIFSLITNVIVPSTLELNLFVDWPNVLLILIIITLLSLNLTAMLHNFEVKKSNSSNSKPAATTLFGGILALFTSACPVCAPMWLVWLGLGSFGAFLSQLSIFVAIVSILFLTISLNYSLKSTCEVKINGKNN